LDKSLIKTEGGKLLLVLVGLLVIFKVVFYREGIISTSRTALALFWILILPGYALMHYWKKRLEFTERIVIGTAVAAAIIAVASYYLGLVGLHVKYQVVVLPLAMLAVAALTWKRKS